MIIIGVCIGIVVGLILVVCISRKCIRANKVVNKRKEDFADQPLLENGHEDREGSVSEEIEDKKEEKKLQRTPSEVIKKYKGENNFETLNYTLTRNSSQSSHNPSQSSSVKPPSTISDNLLRKAQVFNARITDEESAKDEEEDDEFESPPPLNITSHLFAEHANILVALKYIETTSCIIGNIKKLENVNLEASQCPKDISFHLKLLPKGRYRMKTPWRPADIPELSLTFTIGPVKTTQIMKYMLCLRLYGRASSNRFSKPKCYGECTVKLSNLLGAEDGLELVKPLTPKDQHKIVGEGNSFTTDSESEQV